MACPTEAKLEIKRCLHLGWQRNPYCLRSSICIMFVWGSDLKSISSPSLMNIKRCVSGEATPFHVIFLIKLLYFAIKSHWMCVLLLYRKHAVSVWRLYWDRLMLLSLRTGLMAGLMSEESPWQQSLLNSQVWILYTIGAHYILWGCNCLHSGANL